MPVGLFAVFFSRFPLQMGKNVVYCLLSHLCEKYELRGEAHGRGQAHSGQAQEPPHFRYCPGTAKVGDRGQIVIPKEARQFYGIRPGDTVLVLGSGESGLVLSKPEVLDRVAQQILEDMGRNEEK